MKQNINSNVQVKTTLGILPNPCYGIVLKNFYGGHLNNKIQMKATVKIEKEVELKTLVVKAGVRYYEDATVNGIEDTEGYLIPCKQGELWCPIIDIDSGVITNWKQGVKAEVHYKVCDAGSYYLQDAEGNTVLSIEQDYVPKMMCPKESGYGDYIIMDIDENGKIANFRQTLDGFVDED